MNAIASFYLIAYVLLRAELYITRALLLEILSQNRCLDRWKETFNKLYRSLYFRINFFLVFHVWNGFRQVELASTRKESRSSDISPFKLSFLIYNG